MAAGMKVVLFSLIIIVPLSALFVYLIILAVRALRKYIKGSPARQEAKSLFNISPRTPWRHIFRPDCVKNPCNPSGLLRLFALQGKKSISPIRTR